MQLSFSATICSLVVEWFAWKPTSSEKKTISTYCWWQKNVKHSTTQCQLLWLKIQFHFNWPLFFCWQSQLTNSSRPEFSTSFQRPEKQVHPSPSRVDGSRRGGGENGREEAGMRFDVHGIKDLSFKKTGKTGKRSFQKHPWKGCYFFVKELLRIFWERVFLMRTGNDMWCYTVWLVGGRSALQLLQIQRKTLKHLKQQKL